MAATLYPDDAPSDVQPVTCFGDGNCLFRALSIIFFGKEDHHTEFRIRAICELAKNEKSYLNNDFLHSLTGATNVVESLLPSSVFVNAKDSSASYRREVLRTLKPFTFANMWHMFSLANVLGCTVQSVYPDVQNPGTNRSLVNIFIRPAVAADPNVKIMWSHCSNTSKKGWGPNHFVPLIPVGAVGKQKGEWVNVKGKRKIGKRNAESPVGGQEKQKAESPVTGNKKQKVESPVKGNEKRKAVSPDKGNEKPKAESPDKENGKPKAESPDQGNEKQKVESPVKGNEKPRAESSDKGKGKPKVESPIEGNEKQKVESPVKGNEKPKAESPVKGNQKQKVESPIKGNEKWKAESPVKGNKKRKVESPVKGNEKRKAESPVNEITGKKTKGAGKYDCTFKKDWTKEWSFITAANDPHSFHCVICTRDVSCKHQGRADVERHINKDIHQNNTKRLEGQKKLPFRFKQDPLAEKVCYIFQLKTDLF